MPRKIPDDIENWVRQLRRSEVEEMGEEERRILADMLYSPIMRKALVKLFSVMDDRRKSADTLNLLVPDQASEALRLQGEGRVLLAVFETLWEMADAAE
jgi:hypothetical protein